MRNIPVCLFAVILLLSSCNKISVPADDQGPESLKTRQEIDAYIKDQLFSTGSFWWKDAPDNIVWSALQQSDKIMSIGYKPSGMLHVEDMLDQIDIHSPSWTNAKAAVLNIIFTEERKLRSDITPESLEVFPENVLPVINVRVENYATLVKLRNSPLVRYAEPMGYEPAYAAQVNNAVQSSSGCGSNVSSTGLISGVDYTNILPNASSSWNYPFHKIATAWTRATGSGIKVFIIDTGLSPDQDNLNGNFNQGYSSGRSVEKIVTLPQTTFLGIPTGSPETPADGCGHGTAMAGACAAPRCTDGNSVGIAYNCNLVTCRAAADVYLDESREIKGVSDAYINAANRSDVRIISMSMGKLTSSSQISDAIKYAAKKNKLMFCAGGTSFDWTAGWAGVIFPASMPEVNAVTGIKDNLTTRCDACHMGSEIDFVVVMEKASTLRNPLTLPMTGDLPSTVGGSSVATASTAGMAALVWSKYPSWSTTQVLNRLIASSSYYPNRNSNFGWGVIDADKATK